MALTIVLLLSLSFAVFLPRYGILSLFREWRRARRREQIEDGLKHLLDRESQGRHASPESLAGTLDMHRDGAVRLVAEMEARNLVETRGSELHLTAEGERWALHVVRAHRLWERFLADEARMPLQQVHGEAHRREHRLTADQLDELDAALGHPVRDPHGDLIPPRDGKMPSLESVPLTAWPDDSPARIMHIEDEPAIAFEQILAAGLRLDQVVRVIERTPQRFVLSDGENEYRLAPAVAANVSVASLPEQEAMPAGAVPLNELPEDRHARIVKLDDAMQGFTRRRFLDLGLTPGTVIYPELHTFFRDPRAYRIRGTLIALRNDQAARIWVRPV
jgi:DtxR family Mn-dependent transcriptional regulator